METSGHVIVDGYNILHAWPEYRDLMIRHLDSAAERLIESLRILHDFEGLALTIVFDGKGGELSIRHPDGKSSLTVVYSCSGTTADAVIERLLGRTPSTEGWTIASADAAISQTALSYGARAIGPGELADWIANVERRQRAWLERQR